MLVDCFLFYNEVDMLKYRLDLLYDIVDRFVIVEALQTHTGKPKPLYFDQLKESHFQAYLDKIEHHIIKLPYEEGSILDSKTLASINERYHRNYIGNIIHDIAPSDSDIFILSDLDEIPDPKTLECIKNGSIPLTMASLEQDLYYYNMTSRFKTKWTHPKVFTYEWFNNNNLTCDQIRMNTQQSSNVIKRGGWHLSYFLSESLIKNKIENFCHTEFNTESINSISNIQSSIQQRVSLFDHSIKLDYIPIESNTYLPPKIFNKY